MMIAIPLGEPDKTTSIQVRPAEMQVIGILALAKSAREEPDLPFLRIDVEDLAHRPGTRGDGVPELPRGDVVEIQMRPAAPLAHPEELATAMEPVPPGLLRIVDEGLRGLLDDDAHRAGGGVHREDSIALVAALVVVEIGLAAVRRPGDPDLVGLGEGIGKEGRVDHPTLFTPGPEEDELWFWQGSPGFA